MEYNMTDKRTRPCEYETSVWTDVYDNPPEDLQTCVVWLSSRAVLSMYSNGRFYGVRNFNILKNGHNQEQKFELTELHEQPEIWMPIITPFEYYKYCDGRRSVWRKSLAKRLMTEKPGTTKEALIKILNKIKPFPQVIRNVYDSDLED